ncbi:PREDICTED: UDP-glucuronosyltransferase 2A3-like [Nicrophorus vespilloides]|uniref:UDP-glucuronosyltransferase n=1 Tax=Nicrophorus vespilloides TaxID=110193 RepID=A0ABM1MAJ4_NICVS|nr:PREDICTED: UDP-glucuronosyltransferase 2A3-like [Nicrophorus vespilloides]
MAKVALVFFLLAAALACGDAAKILGMFAFPSQSHHILGKALMKELAARGHQVTMVSPFPFKTPPKNYRDVTLHNMLAWKQSAMKKISNPNIGLIQKQAIFHESLPDLTRAFFEEKELQQLLKSGEKFDLAINMMGYTEAVLAVGHLLNATNIGFSIMGGMPIFNYHTAIPSPHAYVPATFYYYSDKMTFFERVINTLFSIGFEMMIHFKHYPNQRAVVKEYYPELCLDKIMKDVDLHLITSHHATESPRPHLTNTIQIGGFHLYDREELPADLKQFMDKSKHGVIFFSLGSNIKTAELKGDVMQQFIKAFSNSKYDFLMKYEKDLPNLPKNIKISSWLPQKAILEHPKCKVFITHGGLGSIAESIHNGVPMIAIPFFGDQRKNVADSIDFGYALQLEITNITERIVTDAIKEVTENPSYLKAAKFRSDIYRNQEMNPMDKAVFWVEHVIKHGGAKHMKSMATELKWYQYMLLDVFAFLGAILLIAFGLIYFTLKKIACCICKKQCKKAPTNSKKVKKN